MSAGSLFDVFCKQFIALVLHLQDHVYSRLHHYQFIVYIYLLLLIINTTHTEKKMYSLNAL